MLLKSRRKTQSLELEPTSDTGSAMPVADHLTELRSRMIRSAVTLCLTSVIAFSAYNQILSWLTGPYCDVIHQRLGNDASCRLVITNPMDGIGTRLRVAAYGGLFLASPLLLWEMWKFVCPGLNKKERQLAIPFILSSVCLFCVGGAIAFWTLPKALDFLIAIAGNDVTPLFSPSSYIKLVVLMIVAFGIAFEVPVVLVFLQLANVITSTQLRRSRRYAIVLNFFGAAVLTPSQDPYSLLAMAIPMCLLFEVAIILGRIAKR